MRLAAITSCYNEPEFVSQFLRHYSPRVDRIFLIDNESTDGTLDPVKDYSNVEVSTYSTGGFFDGYRKQDEVLGKKTACTGLFDYVLILDVDELVIPRDGSFSLKEALDRLPGHPLYGTEGYNMYTYPGDPPYDPGKPLVEQRKRGVRNEYYCKPIVVRPEYNGQYGLGFHYVDGIIPKLSPFYLLHYRGFDDEIFVRRCIRFSKRVPGVGRNYNGGGFYYWGGTGESFLKKLNYERINSPYVQVIP